MAKRATKKKPVRPKRPVKAAPEPPQGNALTRWVLRVRWWFMRLLIWVVALAIFAVLAYRVINPPTTIYMMQEARRLGGVDYEWVPIESIAPIMARSVVAAEDANFCLHWGFDMAAIRAALADGGQRGGSTISQQVTKNAYLWQGRSWLRKAFEALLTPAVEAAWPKRRILEVYLNIIEFDEGVFGIEAASRHYFGIGPEDLTARQAARLAAVLPNPKRRSASNPTASLRRRAASIQDGAELIRKDGRAECFEG